MVDNLKFILKNYSPKEGKFNWSIYNKLDIQNKIFHKSLLYNGDKKKYPLRLLLTSDEEKDEFSLSVTGSIRKWYFQENSRRDLSLDEFLDCTRLLAKELGIDHQTLLRSKITQLEIGITVTLKSDMRDIIHCFLKHRNAEREIYKKTTLYFYFENYKLVFYDKYLEMKDNRLNTYAEKRVYEKFYLMRFEISINKMSGTVFKGKFDTFERIIDNFEKIPFILEKQINDIVYVDVISEEKKPEIESYSDFINHFIFLGVKDFGIKESIDLFDKKVKSSNKSKMLNKFLGIYRSNITDNSDPKAKLLFELRKKLNRLYNKSNI